MRFRCSRKGGRAAAVTLALVALLLLPTGCAESRGDEPDRVVVQHILVAFSGTLPERPMLRNENEARSLAQDLLERARAGEDFDALVKEYTDDEHPGIYAMVNRGLEPGAPGEYQREDMVTAFGDSAFSLRPGEIALCEYDPTRSPFGFHILKRIE